MYLAVPAKLSNGLGQNRYTNIMKLVESEYSYKCEYMYLNPAMYVGTYINFYFVEHCLFMCGSIWVVFEVLAGMHTTGRSDQHLCIIVARFVDVLYSITVSFLPLVYVKFVYTRLERSYEYFFKYYQGYELADS